MCLNLNVFFLMQFWYHLLSYCPFSFYEYVKYCIYTHGSKILLSGPCDSSYVFIHSFIHSNLGEHLLSPRHWEFKRSRVCFQRVYNLEGEIKLHSDTREYMIRNEQYAGKRSRNREREARYGFTLSLLLKPFLWGCSQHRAHEHGFESDMQG